jgi:hypothetical protein
MYFYLLYSSFICFDNWKIWIDDVLLNGNTVAYSFPWYPVVLDSGTHTLKLKISGGGKCFVALFF